MTQHVIRVDDEVYDYILKVKHRMEAEKRKSVSMSEAATQAVKEMPHDGS